jgi:hypothetical protein
LWSVVSTSIVTLVFPAFQCAMATRSGSGSHGGGSQNRGDDAHVADLMERLNLTKDEEEVAAFSDNEEDDGSGGSLEFALTGKVLSPTTLHISMITSAMRPAWGNPFGLRLRSVGEKADSLFIAEFGCLVDKQKVLEGSPSVVGRYAVILLDYDESLKPSDISFIMVLMWVRILDLPFGWMNARRGSCAAGLIGEVLKIDTDAEGKAYGAFLRARVQVDMPNPYGGASCSKKINLLYHRNGLQFSMKIFPSSVSLVG